MWIFNEMAKHPYAKTLVFFSLFDCCFLVSVLLKKKVHSSANRKTELGKLECAEIVM